MRATLLARLGSIVYASRWMASRVPVRPAQTFFPASISKRVPSKTVASFFIDNSLVLGHILRPASPIVISGEAAVKKVGNSAKRWSGAWRANCANSEAPASMNLMLVRRLPFFRPLWLCLEHAQPFRGDLEFVASAYQPPSSNHVHRGLHAANRTTAARVVDPTGSGNEVSVEPSLTQRSDPRLVHEWSSTSGMMVPKQEAHLAFANRAKWGPCTKPTRCQSSSANHDLLEPMCKDTWVKDGIRRRRSIASWGSGLPITVGAAGFRCPNPRHRIPKCHVGAENLGQLMQQLDREKEMGLDPTKNKEAMDYTIKFLFPFVASTFFILLPISALPFFISLFMVLILACLKLLRPLLQPLISLLLEPLYESKQGVLTQIAWILGAVSKAVQEILKHVV